VSRGGAGSIFRRGSFYLISSICFEVRISTKSDKMSKKGDKNRGKNKFRLLI